MFDTVLIANRGEIARRVIRTLRRLGIRSVAVYSDADAGAPFVREADEAVRIGDYLDPDAILGAARATGAQAIHPGYGFLSENAAFARACEETEGVTFIGPPSAAIELMGDKIASKATAEEAGVPIVPGLNRPGLSDDDIVAWAQDQEYPLLVKAAAGGGGRGMRVVERPEQLREALAAARREAKAGFGDDAMFAERFVPRARHIEVQVLADRHGNVVHLGERECSLQRRHQKVVEEAPSPVVDGALRTAFGENAVALARKAGYVGAGTVEFIADADDPSQHWFMEMNARLQVEHPVTELVTGLDLVELQLRVAAGEPLPFGQDDVTLTGHAIEVRVNAEDPTRDFLPASGPVLAYAEPSGHGLRVDSAIEAGSEVGTGYDSMLAKVIAHAKDREGALARLDRGLADLAILGLTTNAGWLRELLATDEVRSGDMDTGFIGRTTLPLADEDGRVAAAAALIEGALSEERAGADPFDRVDNWRLGGLKAWSYRKLAVDGGDPHEVRTRGTTRSAEVDGVDGTVGIERVAGDAFSVTWQGRRHRWTYAQDGDVLWLGRAGRAWRVRQASVEEAHDAAGGGDLRAPMPGQVLSVVAAEGDTVKRGDPVIVLESMKMEVTVAAPADGTVTEISAKEGDRVVVDQVLARLDA